ncbi:MAG TPA: ATP-binding protein [Dermatophilaceae bacterium]|nr:ATP-binding protein [Dermatophilaceae bacterium]
MSGWRSASVSVTNEGCLQLAIAPVTLCHSTVAQVHQLCHGVHVTLTADAFQDLVEELRDHGGDKTNVEVKLGAGGCPRLGETLSAFGNMPSGGLIVVGLDEASDFDPVGVADPTAIEAGIASQARNSVVPPVQVTFDRVSTEGAVIVVARVNPLPLSQRPCRHQGNAYLRQADGDYRMSEPEVQQILALRDRPRFDAAAVPGTQLSDLDPDLTQAYVAAVRSSTRRLADASNEAVLRHRGVLVPQGPELTVAGLYALGAYPQQFAPSLAITAAVHLDPRTGARTRDLVHLDGPIPALLEDAMAWVVRNTRATIRYGQDGHAREEYEIPAVAVRELVANALVHRDLSPHTQGKRVEIRLTGDLLVISSPGGLWGIDQAQLGRPLGKSAVNEFLYEICKLVRTESGARVIEGEGGGIRDAQLAMTKANLRPPRFIDKGVSFTALLPRHSLIAERDLMWLSGVDRDGRLTDVQRRLVVSMRHGTEWTNGMVRAEFAPMDSLVARAELQGLVNAGLAESSGERGQTTYRLASTLELNGERTERPLVVVTPTPTATDPSVPLFSDGPTTNPASPGSPGASVTRHGPAIWAALARGPLSARSLTTTTGLSVHQIRNALAALDKHGWLTVHGGWGHRGTTYERRSP